MGACSRYIRGSLPSLLRQRRSGWRDRGRVLRVAKATHGRMAVSGGRSDTPDTPSSAAAAAAAASRQCRREGGTAPVGPWAEGQPPRPCGVKVVGPHAKSRGGVVRKGPGRRGGVPAREGQAALVPIVRAPHRGPVLRGPGARPHARRGLGARWCKPGGVGARKAVRHCPAAEAVPAAAQAAAWGAGIVSGQRADDLAKVSEGVVVPRRGGAAQAGRARRCAAVVAGVGGRVVSAAVRHASDVPGCRVSGARGQLGRRPRRDGTGPRRSKARGRPRGGTAA